MIYPTLEGGIEMRDKGLEVIEYVQQNLNDKGFVEWLHNILIGNNE